MPMTLEQYADSLTTRDLVWPAPPTPQPVKAKPHTSATPGIRAVAWNIYGTLLSISTGNLVLKHPQKLIMEVALDKTIKEFNMWGSMSRKPGQPSEYMGQLYDRALDQLRMAPSHGEKFPEIPTEKIWDDIVKKLQQKDYKFDAGKYGGINDYVKKIALFFHASMQGTALFPGGAKALDHIRSCGVKQGFLADAQCFTLAQLTRALGTEMNGTVDDFFDRTLRALSFEVGGRKPSDRLFKHFLSAAQRTGIEPGQVLHIGSRIIEDIAPAKKLGMRTALFAGDKESLQATPDQLKDAATRPDLLLTDLSQLADVIEPA
jgi:FMN phosphatase YigB (HAD superfamily)